MDGIRSGKYICNVLGGGAATVAHDTYDEAKAEALRLCKSTNRTVIVAKVACVCQNEPVVHEDDIRTVERYINYPKYAIHVPSNTYGMIIMEEHNKRDNRDEYLFATSAKVMHGRILLYDSVQKFPANQFVVYDHDDEEHINMCIKSMNRGDKI